MLQQLCDLLQPQTDREKKALMDELKEEKSMLSIPEIHDVQQCKVGLWSQGKKRRFYRSVYKYFDLSMQIMN